MTPKEMSQNITIQGQKVSERTIKRWLKWLKTHHYFTYYPHVITERIGLAKTVVFLSGLKNHRILDIIPYKTYSMFGTELNSLRKTFVVHYALPKEYLKNFEKFWRKVLDKGLVDDYKVLKLKCSRAFYAPIHQLVNEDGKLDLPKDSGFNTDTLAYETLDVEMHHEIEKNPFLVPLLIEYYKAYISSKKVWHESKQKLSENIWDYIRDGRVRSKKSDGSSICFVHRTLDFLHRNFNVFFKQIRMAYGPLYRDNNITLCIALDLKKGTCATDILRAISAQSLFMAYNESFAEERKLFLEVTTNTEGMNEIFHIVSNFTNIGKVSKMVLLNYAKSSQYWEDKTKGWLKQHYHELFDPKTVSWSYDSEKYLSELKQLPASGE
jgi:hypothetical protein